MRRMLAALVLCCAGCWSIGDANLKALSEEYELELTEAECTRDIEPLNSVYVHKSGFYLFGYLPIVAISMPEAFHELCKLAKKAGADGICNIRYRVEATDPFKFVIFPIPDWSARIEVHGMAWRRSGSAQKAGLERRQRDP